MFQSCWSFLEEQKCNFVPLHNSQLHRRTTESILQEHWRCSVQKPARKNTKYSRHETILKVGHFTQTMQRPQPLPNGQTGSTIKNAKNMQKKNILKEPQKKQQIFAKSDSFKFGHLKNGTPYAKFSLWDKILKCQVPEKNHCTRTLELFCAKHCSKKHQIFEK